MSVCMCLYECMKTYVGECPQKPQHGIGSVASGVAGIYELPGMCTTTYNTFLMIEHWAHLTAEWFLYPLYLDLDFLQSDQITFYTEVVVYCMHFKTLNIYLFNFLCMVISSKWMYFTVCMPDSQRIQKRVSGPLEIKMQMAVTMWALGTKRLSFVRAESVHNHWSSHQTLLYYF